MWEDCGGQTSRVIHSHVFSFFFSFSLRSTFREKVQFNFSCCLVFFSKPKRKERKNFPFYFLVPIVRLIFYSICFVLIVAAVDTFGILLSNWRYFMRLMWHSVLSLIQYLTSIIPSLMCKSPERPEPDALIIKLKVERLRSYIRRTECT